MRIIIINMCIHIELLYIFGRYSEFSFSEAGCFSPPRQPSLSNYLSIVKCW